MRPHLDAMWAEHDRLVQRVTRVVTATVPSYAQTPSSEVWIGMTRILERAAHGNPFGEPGETDRIAALGTGAQGARAGIAAEDLVAAVLLGAREVEHEVMEHAAAAGLTTADLLDATRRARSWAEQMAVWAVEGLRNAASDDRGPDPRHHQLITALETGAEVQAHSTALDLGLDPSVPWWAIAGQEPADPRSGAGATLRLANPGALWSAPRVEDLVTSYVGLTRHAPRVPSELVAGVARAPDLAGLSTALRDARRALRVGLRFDRQGAVGLPELGLLVPLHEDPALASRLVERWAAPLTREPRHALAATLWCWLEQEGHVEPTAIALGVHANTVRNRLARADRLLGDWRSPHHRAEVWAALQLLR